MFFVNSILVDAGEDRIKGQAGLWDVDERYARLSAADRL
jgi:hypothetical protein